MAFKVYFGVPGSGKTTHAAKIVSKNKKKGIKTYSNVPISGAYKLDAKGDIGNFDISYCDIIIDEAGIEYNNRSYKTLPKEQIVWFKFYRHYHVRNIYVFSQSWDDMDITLRRLATELWLCRRCLIPWFFKIKRIRKNIRIDEATHQIIDGYDFVLFSTKFTFAPRYWKLFNSYDAPKLPEKEWFQYD